MANPILDRITAQSALNPQMIARIKSIMQSANSPEMQLVNQLTSGKGISAEQAVTTLCAQRGIDVSQFMGQIRSAMK